MNYFRNTSAHPGWASPLLKPQGKRTETLPPRYVAQVLWTGVWGDIRRRLTRQCLTLGPPLQCTAKPLGRQELEKAGKAVAPGQGSGCQWHFACLVPLCHSMAGPRDKTPPIPGLSWGQKVRVEPASRLSVGHGPGSLNGLVGSSAQHGGRGNPGRDRLCLQLCGWVPEGVGGRGARQDGPPRLAFRFGVWAWPDEVLETCCTTM